MSPPNYLLILLVIRLQLHNITFDTSIANSDRQLQLTQVFTVIYRPRLFKVFLVSLQKRRSISSFSLQKKLYLSDVEIALYEVMLKHGND